jgi:hypothetical protein
MDSQTKTNDITTVREALFNTLEGLRNKTIDLDHAKAINEVAQTLINSAKAEVDALRVLGGNGTGFIPALLDKPEQKPALQNLRDKGILPADPSIPGISHPMPGVTRHTC